MGHWLQSGVSVRLFVFCKPFLNKLLLTMHLTNHFKHFILHWWHLPLPVHLTFISESWQLFDIEPVWLGRERACLSGVLKSVVSSHLPLVHLHFGESRMAEPVWFLQTVVLYNTLKKTVETWDSVCTAILCNISILTVYCCVFCFFVLPRKFHFLTVSAKALGITP